MCFHRNLQRTTCPFLLLLMSSLKKSPDVPKEPDCSSPPRATTSAASSAHAQSGQPAAAPTPAAHQHVRSKESSSPPTSPAVPGAAAASSLSPLSATPPPGSEDVSCGALDPAYHSSRLRSRPQITEKPADGSMHFSIMRHPREALEVMSVLRRTRKLCDVTLVAGEERIQAHKIVLAASSPYFRAMFTSGMREEEMSVIPLHGISACTLAQLVEFAYTAEVSSSPLIALPLPPPPPHTHTHNLPGQKYLVLFFSFTSLNLQKGRQIELI